MERLTNQQLILVALLISFVTSLATGIVTVSLMSQAPQGVAQTINQVVERTIEKAVSNKASVESIQENPVDKIASASRVVLNSTVKLRAQNNQKISGLGLIMSSKGVILADKDALPDAPQLEAIFPNGQIVPVSIIQAQLNGNVAFLAPPATVAISTLKPVPATIASSTTLGQDVFSISLSGTSSPVLGQGIIDSVNTISTTIPRSRVMSGSPLFNSNGEIIGMFMTSLPIETGASFFPIASLKNVVPQI